MKYLSAILVFILAVMLQLWFAPGGVRGDFVLAILVVFAFLFGFWELVVFILLGIFLLHATPYPDLAMLMLAAVPLAAYFVRRYFSLDPWFGIAAGIVGGIVVFYAAVAPVTALHAAAFLLLDILACVLFGELVLRGMEQFQERF
jgi:hypothetical protein